MVTVYTIGHSNRSLSSFLDVLGAHSIHGLVDIRSWPSSRRHPHFGRQPLEGTIRENALHKLAEGFVEPEADVTAAVVRTEETSVPKESPQDLHLLILERLECIAAGDP